MRGQKEWTPWRWEASRGSPFSEWGAPGRGREYIVTSASATQRSEILERFAPGQRAQHILVPLHPVRHQFGIAPGEVPERPANCLLEEELGRAERRLDAVGQEREVSVRSEAELADDRGPALPEVSGACPDAHPRGGPCRLAPQHVAQAMSDRVDVVPPRAVDDHLLVHRDRASGLERGVAAVARQLDRRVAVLAMGGAAPEHEDRVAPIVGPVEGMPGEDGAAGPAQRRGRDAEVRHRRLHVALHRWRLPRVRDGGECGADVGNEEASGASHERTRCCLPATTCATRSPWLAPRASGSTEAARGATPTSSPSSPSRSCSWRTSRRTAATASSS